MPRASGQIALVMTGDDVKATQAFDRLNRKVRKMEAELKGSRRAAKQLKASTKNIDKAFNIDRLKNWVVGLTGAGGVLAAFRLITAEIRQVIDLQRQAGQQQISVGAARAQVIRNLVGVDPGEIKSVLERTTGIATRQNIDERFIASAVASALSASGGNVKASLAAVEQAAKFLATEPTAIPQFAGSLLDLSKVTGSSNARVNQGLLTAVAGLSRVTEPAQQARVVAPALIGEVGFGATPREAAALFAALTVGSADVRGDITGTGAIKLVQQLGDFFKDRKNAPATVSGKIAALQADAALSKEFLGTASFETKALAPILNLLSGRSSDISRLFLEDLKRIGSNEELAKLADQSIKNLGIDKLAPAAEASRILASGTQQLQIANVTQGLAGISREGLVNVLKASGLGATAETFVKGEFEARSLLGTEAPVGVAANILRNRAADLERSRFRGGPVGTRFNVNPELIPPSGADVKTAEILRKVADKLDKVVNSLDRQTDDRKETLRGGASIRRKEIAPRRIPIPENMHGFQGVFDALDQLDQTVRDLGKDLDAFNRMINQTGRKNELVPHTADPGFPVEALTFLRFFP